MSRPPRPYAGQSTTAASLVGSGDMDYLPSEYADFIERQRALAQAELGRVSSGQEGDFALTLMELSAVVAHVLGVYQDRFAREAFLGAAQTAQSLARHGRRLGYEPDPGLAATGYLLITVHDGLSGTLPRGFGVASAPVGERKAQDYETTEDVQIHHRHNELRVRTEDRYEGVTITPDQGLATLEILGGGLGLQPGDVVVLETDAGALSAHTVAAATESADGAATAVTVSWSGPATAVSEGFRLHARPAARLRLFGWDTSPLEISDAELKAGAFALDGTPPGGHGYVVAGHATEELYLGRTIDAPALGAPVVVIDGAGAAAYRAGPAAPKRVIFRKQTAQTVTVWELDQSGAPVLVTQSVPVIHEIAGDATALRVEGAQGPILRTAQDVRGGLWLLGFERAAPLAHRRPSQQPAGQVVTLDDLVDGLVPGQRVALERAEGDLVEIAEITSVGEHQGRTTLGFTVVQPPGGARAWTLGELRIRGNVAPLSHGKTLEEVLGDSDGTSPFLRFALRSQPLTHLPGPDGGAPALEVRVGGVLWERVRDLHDSGADDRHYLLQRDADGTTSVVFGDGKRGAVPPAGKRHVTARYRVGLGRDGDAGAGGVRRVKKAHPLVARAHNPLPVAGGADPAGASEIRAQAARFIKTFDRAVSPQDHADLALLYPGVARAAAHTATDPAARRELVRVIVADAAGEQPASLLAIKRFLEARRDNTLPLEVTAPAIKDVSVALYLEIDPAYLPEAVRAAVRAALHGDREGAPGLFTFAGRALGQPAFLSEIYAAITAIAGVSFVEVTRFVLGAATTARVLDAIPAAPGEWLRLSPQHLELASAAEATP